MNTAVAVDQSTWMVPRDWPRERCFVICSGKSVSVQAAQIKRLQGRFIAVKHGVLLRPDADVLFLAGEPEIELSLLPRFRGTHVVIRSSKRAQSYPGSVNVVTRTKHHERLCDLRDHVCGYDLGTSAINLAYHFGATEIVLLGYDMRGKHFCKHPLPNIPQQHFDRHMKPLEALARDCEARGIKVVNCSPISAAPGFQHGRLEDYL